MSVQGFSGWVLTDSSFLSGLRNCKGEIILWLTFPDRSTDRPFAWHSKLLSLSLCGDCRMKEKGGSCVVNYSSLLDWPLALCLALLSESLQKMNLWYVVYCWLSSFQIPGLQQQPFLCLMILWARNSGQAQLLSDSMPCRVDWGHVWYLVGRWAGSLWRVGGSFTQNSSTSSGRWLSAKTGLASMGGVRGGGREGGRGRSGEERSQGSGL